MRTLNDTFLAGLAREFGTPLWVYDANVIEERVASLRSFDVVRYAQKANGNLSILRSMKRFGVELDAVSAGEIERALAAGFAPEEIVFTADMFDRAALATVARTKVRANLGSPFMVEEFAAACPGRDMMLRVNPGFGHGHGRKVQTGGEASKHGIWHAELPSVIERARRAGLRVVGLHVHIGSGSDFEHLARVTESLEKLAPLVGDTLAVVSAGGGLPTPYTRDDKPFDVARFVDVWLAARERIARRVGHAIRLEVEPGRFLVAESGCLLTEVLGSKTSGNVEYVFVDAGFNELVRPAMYGAYHEITVLGRPSNAPLKPRVVAGPLCESGDVFTVDKHGELAPRALPDVTRGDIACIHDVGAYGSAMSSHYNARPLAAEILVENGVARLVRRRQTIAEMLELERGMP
ncbi:MAG: diaminopimelate decarboxylase [Planctomycetota bacterium]|nr:diaminopimelate decarboxylase [Planctomycetota bacterium]